MNKKPRVLIVTDKGYVLSGGRYYSYGGTQKELNAISAVCELTVLVSVEKRQQVPHGYEPLSEEIQVYSNGLIRYWYALPAFWIMFLTFVRVKRLQSQFEFDIIVGKAPREVGIAAILASRATKTYSIFHYSYDWVPNVTEEKGPLLNIFLRMYRCPIWFVRKKLLKAACKISDSVTTVSHEFARQLASLSGTSLPDISLLRTTFTLQDMLFEIPPITVDTPPNILFVGRMDSNKNVSLLLRAFGQARKDGFKGTLHLAGQGPEFQRLVQLTNELELNNVVRFLGYVGNDQLPELLNNSLALVLPSFSEGFPKVLLEASAAARPLFGSNIAGNKEILEHERNGFLFDPHNSHDLADKLLKLNDRQKMIGLGLEAREMVMPYRPKEAIKAWQKAFARGIDSRKIL